MVGVEAAETIDDPLEELTGALEFDADAHPAASAPTTGRRSNR